MSPCAQGTYHSYASHKNITINDGNYQRGGFYISTLSFQQDQDSNFSRKHRRQNFEEQNECMTSWDRRQKAAENNIE